MDLQVRPPAPLAGRDSETFCLSERSEGSEAPYNASLLRCGEDAEKRFSKLLPSISAISWLGAQGVHPDALSLPDLPCVASIVFRDHAPLFDFADEAAEEPMTKALIFLERNGF